MKDKFVLDSSVWIEAERQNPDILTIISPLIAQNRVCIVDLIVAEISRGAKTKRDYVGIKELFSNFDQFSTSWSRVADLAFAVDRRGFHPPLTDLYIAQCCIENHKRLITRDRHFAHIAECTTLKCELV